ncbi:MAG: ABC transporter permease [Dehalococcoidia bacterium]
MFGESLNIAFRALSANKLRTGLTMLGMIIGVAAVIALQSIGAGFNSLIESEFSTLGTNLLTIAPGTAIVGGVRVPSNLAQALTLEDAKALSDAEAAPSIIAVAPERNFAAQVIAQGQNTNARIVATNPAYQDVHNFYPVYGEFFTQAQVDQFATVAVLGQTIATTLFGEADPLDQPIRVTVSGLTANLRVIGVMEVKGGSGFINRDELIMIPISTGMSRLQSARTATGEQGLSSISVTAASADELRTAEAQIAQVFAGRRKTADSYQIFNLQDQLKAVKQVTRVFSIVLSAIAGISLVVAGIGIMNIMIISIAERTREIGIRKAVGARRHDIMLQFLMEAVVVSVSGGVLGILGGVVMSRLIARFEIEGEPFRAVVTMPAAAVAFSISVAIGLFFGIYPASRASKLSPIDALRYE